MQKEMKLYGGNKKRFIKKRAFYNFDGVNYGWYTGQFRLRIMLSLKPGDICFIPYTKEWGEIVEVTPHKFHFSTYGLGTKKGWWIAEVTINVKSASRGSIYCVYDIEHWNCDGFDREGFSIGVKGSKPINTNVMRFNRQVGLPDDYDMPPNWQRWY